MTLLKASLLVLAAFACFTNASPCPFGEMFERGELSEADAAKFLAARSEGSAAVKDMMDAHAAEKEKRDHAKQHEIYKRQINLGALTLGGGLLGGVLQPFKGILSGLAVPTPQPIGIKKVPDEAHPFMYAKSTDVRGMCPTLNTMANHGFINRNGITTFAQASNACQITLGFGYDTCTFLSALGLIAGGDLPTGKYSIGGADARVPNTIGPALGISKHGPFEVDQSISRIDKYFGNQANFHLDRFNRLVQITKKHGNQFGFATFAEERALTFAESLSKNPNFDAGPKHFGVSLAERVFIFRALPNGTDPTNANFRNIAPFYLNETFPDNWFVRGTPYTLPNVGTDVVQLYAMGPTPIGKNQNGKFLPSGIDVSKYTPSQILCFIETSALDLTPGSFSPALAKNYDTFVAFFNGAVKPFFASAGCDDLIYVQPGPNAGDTSPGVNSGNILYKGVYQSTAPSAPPEEGDAFMHGTDQP